MKKITTLLALLMLTNFNSYSQNKGQGLAVAAGAIAGIGAAIAVNNQIKEQLELFATDYVLKEYDFEAFKLKVNGISDESQNQLAVTAYAFSVSILDKKNFQPIQGQQFVLVAFLDNGWMNEFGIDQTKVKFFHFDKDTWSNIYSTYIGLATGIEIKDNKIPIYSRKKNLQFVEKYKVLKPKNEEYYFTGKFKDLDRTYISKTGIEARIDSAREELILPFEVIDGDSYVVKDYSDELKIIFNEKSLGLYIKEIERLVQLRRNLLEDITNFVIKGHGN